MQQSEADRLFAAAGAPILFAQFGVPVTFTPDSGLNRSVVAILDYVQADDSQAEHETRQQERMWVTVRRDSEHPDGGIGEPKIGDAIFREEDGTGQGWGFQGQIRNVTADTWDLLFGRNRPRRYGPKV